MRILLDENLPHELGKRLQGRAVTTVAGRGWAGVQNGALLQMAAGRCDAFLTMDRRLSAQQRIADLPFSAILIQAPTNRLSPLDPLVPKLLEAVEIAQPGSLHIVGA